MSDRSPKAEEPTHRRTRNRHRIETETVEHIGHQILGVVSCFSSYQVYTSRLAILLPCL